MLDGLGLLFSDTGALFWLIVAVPIGMIFGAIPGLGGKIALISVMPFLAGMDTLAGSVFLISLHAVVHTGAAAPTILFGIPGTGPSTAVVMDGHAMAKNGDATRAITAAAVSSGVGGLVGTVVLAMIVPFAITLMKLVSYPEIFMLTLFGLTFSALLSDKKMLRGLSSGCLGLLLAYVGIEQVYGVHRFTFGLNTLSDGVDLITAVLAFFAIPEMLMLGRSKKPSADRHSEQGARHHGQILRGVRDVLYHRALTLRCGVLGAVIGIIPGLGGDVAAWLCYGHAAQSSRHPEKFGKGAVEGVIGPEAANNSKEGGALVPTLFLGIPGSSGMAILLVALVPLGISPGPGFVSQHSDLIWAMVWALAISNVAAAAALILLTKPLGQFSRVKKQFIVPYVYLLAMASIFISTTNWQSFGVMLALSAIGYAMLRDGWPRAPFVIGLILGAEAEEALVKSLSLWGPGFLLRPGTLLLAAMLLISLVNLSRRLTRQAKTAARVATTEQGDSDAH